MSFTIQMLVKCDIIVEDKQIYFKTDNWNKSLADGYSYGIYDNGDWYK